MDEQKERHKTLLTADNRAPETLERIIKEWILSAQA
jgi:hypothetical protein